MVTSLSGEIRETFRKAALQHEAARGLKGYDWARYRQIQSDHEKRCRDERRNHEREYQSRFEHARRRLVDEGGAKRRILSPRLFGRDVFSRDEIDRQAHRTVRSNHERTLAQFEARKESELNALFGAVDKRQALGRQLKQDFERAANRRSGQERRPGPAR